ncbi:ATP-dependent helicase HrpB [Litorihabitans aurantiacus]|uniref:ATP-dependent helicase n=1 Tax=Litorihabitans aurantiacus TaxID=1930061 RepID=A0AA37XDY8_9MICO|nr:ATP-dependent helicase HrpB [Litorihabitans aurantiacus]GMA31393.1 ATP-dependent helicase [Litorihabitans aurantiacus]
MPDPIAALLAAPPDLPVAAVLPHVATALRERGVAVVHAPPGTGKTTLVPPLVAHGRAGRVVVTQPRRLAARAAARRLATLLGEEVGGTVGWSVRGERRTSAATRVEFVTTGVLLRRLQSDPELVGTDAVVLDEVHERAIDADLLQAMLHEVRQTLRPDLAVVAMSATLESERLATLWGDDVGPAPEITSPGGLHPVAEVWCPPARPVVRTDDRGTTRAWLDHVAATARRAVVERTGDVLVFVPGVGEVERVVRLLAGVSDGGGPLEVLRLHGRLEAGEQDRALRPGRTRRVIVSTAVAESSVTVPGVRVVVDAGLARESRTDPARGLAGLVTVAVSRDGATQRAGRAGREGPGVVYRLWTQGDHARLAPHRLPEIATGDLTELALAAASWSRDGVAGLALLDPPPAPALEAATVTLRALGALDTDGLVTPRGRLIADVPVHPRLARALLDGAAAVGARVAAEVVALLGEEVRVPDADLTAALRALRRSGGGGGGVGAGEWRRAVDRLTAIARSLGLPERGSVVGATADDAVAHVVALAHPDRLARSRGDGATYLLAGGTGAVLPENSPLRGAPWLAVADVTRTPGRRDAVVRAAVPLDEEAAVAAAPALIATRDEVEFDGGRLRARSVERLGAIELRSRVIGSPEQGAVIAALQRVLRRDGLDALAWSAGASALRARLAFLHEQLGEPWPAVDDASLLDHLETFLAGRRVRSLADLRRLDMTAALRQLLPWPAAARLDELAPERMSLPSGRQVPLDYTGAAPVAAVKVQDAFGLRETPRLADGGVAVVMHLLSPAGRPAAVTADMASFWANGYAAVRSDLRGRYPKHAWPEVP